jgi:hypothetical protein
MEIRVLCDVTSSKCYVSFVQQFSYTPEWEPEISHRRFRSCTRNILGWCTSSCGFCLRRLFPNKNCMLAMCNTPFYSFRFPLSNLFGIFRFELRIRKCQDQNHGVSSWEKRTFPTPSSLRVQSRLQSCRGRSETFVLSTEKIITERTAPKWFERFKKGNFDKSDTPQGYEITLLSVCLCIPPINFWMPELIFIKLCTYITAPEPVSTA